MQMDMPLYENMKVHFKDVTRALGKRVVKYQTQHGMLDDEDSLQKHIRKASKKKDKNLTGLKK